MHAVYQRCAHKATVWCNDVSAPCPHPDLGLHNFVHYYDVDLPSLLARAKIESPLYCRAK